MPSFPSRCYRREDEIESAELTHSSLASWFLTYYLGFWAQVGEICIKKSQSVVCKEDVAETLIENLEQPSTLRNECTMLVLLIYSTLRAMLHPFTISRSRSHSGGSLESISSSFATQFQESMNAACDKRDQTARVEMMSTDKRFHDVL